MRITESQLRKIVRQEARRLLESGMPGASAFDQAVDIFSEAIINGENVDVGSRRWLQVLDLGLDEEAAYDAVDQAYASTSAELD
jgi:hypothetical protein